MIGLAFISYFYFAMLQTGAIDVDQRGGDVRLASARRSCVGPETMRATRVGILDVCRGTTSLSKGQYAQASP